VAAGESGSRPPLRASECGLAKYVYPHLEDIKLVDFAIGDADQVMANLPPNLSASTRRQVAQLMHRVLSMAVYPARIIAANPLPRGFLPKPSKGKAYPILYPDEDLQLLKCSGEAGIPIEVRLLYGFLHREGCRRSEALRLRFRDFDLERGTVLLDENKTDDPRMWALSPGVAAAIQLYRDNFRPTAEADDYVFVNGDGVPITDDHMADHIREDLKLAKIERDELHKQTAKRGRFGTRGFRRSFVTLNLAAGKSESWICDRTGHKSSAMVARYKQAARSIAELNLGTLAPLDGATPDLSIGPRLGQDLRARTDSNGRPPDSKCGGERVRARFQRSRARGQHS
jgi:integrase